jgi:hypothetical protein
MTHSTEKSFILGGSIETALSGQYQLSPVAVFQEALKHTIRHFISFTPSIVILLIVQIAIFYIALQLQIGDPVALLSRFLEPDTITSDVLTAIMVANFSYEVISAPIYAGVCLMGMSHAAGLKTKPKHILKGLQFTIPLILATMVGLILQGIAGQLLFVLSLYLSVAFSNAVLLICEKRIAPISALLLSLRAVNKKLMPLLSIYLVIMALFVLATIFYGFPLLFVLPLYFHVKGIVYRNMFGITLKIVATDSDDHPDSGNRSESHSSNTDSNKDSDIFNA